MMIVHAKHILSETDEVLEVYSDVRAGDYNLAVIASSGAIYTSVWSNVHVALRSYLYMPFIQTSHEHLNR